MPAPPPSQGLPEGFGVLFNGSLVALVPSPVTFFLGFDQSGFLQDSHVVRDGGLGEVDAFLDVAGAKSDFLADRAGTANLQDLKDATAGGIGDGVEKAGEGLVLAGHGVRNRRKIDGCQCGDFRWQI
jgi:hypothetical protein